jgi:chorismate mutase|tara:strand:- start:90 stop:371 length:282 start_codon:yes stop_codon:yes gene_type:complete
MSKNILKRSRNKVDQIDNKIFRLIEKRTRIVKYILSLKKYRKDIVDRKRNNEIFKKIKKKSIMNGIDTKLTKRIWQSIIWGYVDFQRRNFRKK